MKITCLFQTEKSLGPVVLRLGLAAAMFPHGAQKMLGWFGGYGFTGTMHFFTQMLHVPAPLALLAILVEFLAPIALALGFVQPARRTCPCGAYHGGSRAGRSFCQRLFYELVWQPERRRSFHTICSWQRSVLHSFSPAAAMCSRHADLPHLWWQNRTSLKVSPQTHSMNHLRPGHAHLKVSDIDHAVDFIPRLLGLKVTERLANYAFLTSGPEHHTLALQGFGPLAVQPPGHALGSLPPGL